MTENIEGQWAQFERISSPEDLLSFMKDHIRYGFVGKNNRVYRHDDEAMGKDFRSQYQLQTPEELVASGHGVCWDAVELERHWLEVHGYEPATYFMMYAKRGGTKLPTHTFIIYRQGNEWIWFEHSFAKQRGIHKYPDQDSLMDDVKRKYHEYAQQHRGATLDDFVDIRIFKYERPVFNSGTTEFVDGILKNKDLPNSSS